MIEHFLSAILLIISPSYGEGWKGIVPLITTRSEVEKSLGAPVESCDHYCNYNSGDNRIFIRYAGEPCSKENRWTVARDTVVEISVYQTDQPKISELNLDRHKFKKTEDPELHAYYWYDNEQEGISYSVSKDGLLTGSHLTGTAERDRRFRCSLKQIPNND